MRCVDKSRDIVARKTGIAIPLPLALLLKPMEPLPTEVPQGIRANKFFDLGDILR